MRGAYAIFENRAHFRWVSSPLGANRKSQKLFVKKKKRKKDEYRLVAIYTESCEMSRVGLMPLLLDSANLSMKYFILNKIYTDEVGTE